MTHRRTIRFWAAALLMGEIIKHLLSNEYGPFDRLLEIGVFLLILYEIISPYTLIRRRIRRKRLCKIEGDLRGFITDGEAIRINASDWRQKTYDHRLKESAEEWTARVEDYLGQSKRALAEFQRIHLEDAQRLHIDEFGGIARSSGASGDIVQLLGSRLENLHRIAQRCEDYF